jgi:hypothetical protein
MRLSTEERVASEGGRGHVLRASSASKFPLTSCPFFFPPRSGLIFSPFFLQSRQYTGLTVEYLGKADYSAVC